MHVVALLDLQRQLDIREGAEEGRAEISFQQGLSLQGQSQGQSGHDDKREHQPMRVALPRCRPGVTG